MTDFSLIILGGLLGSSHCVGMCGGVAVALGMGAPTWRENLLRQSAYGFGRMFTYGTLGAAAGFGGRKLVLATSLFNVQAVLAIAAGLLLVSQGFRATSLSEYLKRRFRRTPAAAKGPSLEIAPPVVVRPTGFKLPVCLQPGLLGSLLRRSGISGPALGGVMTGFLPCGLVYAMLALAASSGNLADGALTMICFGIGTLPLMIGLGLGAASVSLTNRRRMFQLAAWCIVVTGGLSLARGAYALTMPGRPSSIDQPTPTCPLCKSAGESTSTQVDSPASRAGHPSY